MKTNKMLAAGLAASAIMVLSITSVSAMYGQGNGQGNGNGQGQGQSQMQNKMNGGGEAKQSGHDKNPADMIVNIDKQDLSAIEIDLLAKQYEEEMMANELYTSFYEMYGEQTFNNIANSEAQHMIAVKALLDRYELDIPTNYDHIQSLYDDLKAKGALSLKDALEVGISIEKVDIEDIVTAIKATDNVDIKTVLVNIGGASYNHMRGFVKALDNNNLTTTIDYSAYLSADQINTKGPIKSLLVDRLIAEGVNLPEQTINNNSNNSLNKGNSVGAGNTKMQGERNKYKNTYTEKYSATFKKVGNEKLNEIILKIDDLTNKISNGNYTQTLKEKYMPMLFGLRDSILEQINN